MHEPAAAADCAAFESIEGGQTKGAAPGRLVVLTGPSGVGKGSVMAEMRKLLRPPSADVLPDQASVGEIRDAPVWLSVSATTRPPRPGEVHGRHYFFVSDAEFDDLLTRHELLEWAAFAGNRYGTPREPVVSRLSAGASVLLEIELAGARQIRLSVPEALMVFLAPPSRAELRRRLIGRGTEDNDAVVARLAQADVEIAAADEFDVTIVNDDVTGAAHKLVDLIAGR